MPVLRLLGGGEFLVRPQRFVALKFGVESIIHAKFYPPPPSVLGKGVDVDVEAKNWKFWNTHARTHAKMSKIRQIQPIMLGGAKPPILGQGHGPMGRERPYGNL